MLDLRKDLLNPLNPATLDAAPRRTTATTFIQFLEQAALRRSPYDSGDIHFDSVFTWKTNISSYTTHPRYPIPPEF
ncbi:hypothetical protein EYZ11_005911 [Aspergillus tanneri]|uniref:Uncharacterized protein n=1 Tax=Aspergillus tanneri TaxID=1220188 RepID=A0A4S3JGY4_9EURO|nr:hypothetical protein EYZ11_005911 [Aspergillus tanneri]